MSAGSVVGWGLLGAAAGGTLMALGITPDGLSDEMAKHIANLDTAGVLDGTGIDVISKTDFSNLSKDALEKLGHHFAVEGDKVITFAKEGLTGVDLDKVAEVSAEKLKELGLSEATLKTAAASVNGFATEVSDLVKHLDLKAVINKDNIAAAKEALSKYISPEKAAELVDGAMKAGQSLADYAKDAIGRTPLENADLLAKAMPVGIGAMAGAGAGLVSENPEEKAVIGPATARELARRRQALAQSLQQNGLQMS